MKIGAVAACLFVIGAGAVHAQAAKHATPSEWVQLRGGIDNAGVVPGTLEVSWKFKAPYTVRAISVVNGFVVLGTEVHGADDEHRARPAGGDSGWVGALRVADGKLAWSRRVWSWVHSDAVSDGKRVFVTHGQLPEHLPGGLTAYDLRTGDSLWSVVTSGGVMPAAAIDSKAGTVSFVGADGCLQTLKAANGQPVRFWCIGGSVLMSSPRIDATGDFVVGGGVLTHNRVVSLNVRSGVEHWRSDLSAYHAMSDIPVAMTPDIIYTVGSLTEDRAALMKARPLGEALALMREAQKTFGLDKRDEWFERQWLIALDRKTGKQLWSRALGFGLSISRNHSGSPVLAGSRVFVSSPVSRTLWGFDAEKGHVAWHRPLGAMHRGSPTPIDSVLLIGDPTGTMSIYRQNDGGLVGQCKAPSGFTVTAPILVGKTLFAATKDGTVYAEPWEMVRRRMSLETPMKSCFELSS